MIELQYWPTPNGWQMSIMLEECGLPYTMVPVNIGRGEQFTPEFMALISPNKRMPTIVDTRPKVGGKPITLWDSGAILVYLAEKAGQLLPTGLRERMEVLQWVFWRIGELGPTVGENGHFLLYAPEKIPYAIAHYGQELHQRYTVLETQLARTGQFVAGADYSIADIAILPWVHARKAQNVDLRPFPQVQRWYNSLTLRPAVQRGLALGRDLRAPVLSDEARQALFGTPPPAKVGRRQGKALG